MTVSTYRLIWGLKTAASVVAAVIALGLAVMGLWNWLAPELFGWHPIGFLQAVRLLVLCRNLFGALRGGHRAHWHLRGLLAERLEPKHPGELKDIHSGMRAPCRRESSTAFS